MYVIGDCNKLISIILPVFNADKYLSKALDSILNQTFFNFEVICINDGSNDKSLDILKKYEANDNRIIVISRENKGLIYSLNEAISLAKYDYIARMDADDINRPDRLKKQLSYLTKHQDIAVLGCSYDLIDKNDKLISTRKPVSSSFFIKSSLLFGSPFAHPSVMFNRKLLGNNLYYDEQYLFAEDYELWLRLSKKYKFKNLKDKLFLYRVINTSISRKNKNEQIKTKESAAIAHLISENKKYKFIKSDFYHCNSKYSMIRSLFFQKEKKYILFQILFILLKK